jgi:hypothetical protein
MQYQVWVYRKGPALSKLDEDKYDRLVDLGFDNGTEDDQEWDDAFAILQEYKASYKSLIFPFSEEKEQNLKEKCLPLEFFLRRRQYQIVAYRNDPVFSELDEDNKYNRLMDLDFAVDQEWYDTFALLVQEYKTKYDSCIFPQSKEKLQNLEAKCLPLKLFVFRMRKEVVAYRINPTFSKLDEDKYGRLMNVGLGNLLRVQSEIRSLHLS